MVDHNEIYICLLQFSEYVRKQSESLSYAISDQSDRCLFKKLSSSTHQNFVHNARAIRETYFISLPISIFLGSSTNHNAKKNICAKKRY